MWVYPGTKTIETIIKLYLILGNPFISVYLVMRKHPIYVWKIKLRHGFQKLLWSMDQSVVPTIWSYMFVYKFYKKSLKPFNCCRIGTTEGCQGTKTPVGLPMFLWPGVVEASTRRSAMDGPRRCVGASGRWWAPRSCRASKVITGDGRNPATPPKFKIPSLKLTVRPWKSHLSL